MDQHRDNRIGLPEVVPERQKLPYPNYTRSERLADAVVHVIGVASALVAVTVLFWLFSEHMGWGTFLAVTIYAGAMVLMLVASAAYHMAAHTTLRPVLRRIDHAAIYLKIAGSFTPLAILLGTGFGYMVLGLVWLVALIGAAAKLMAKRGNMTTGWAPQVALGWVGLLLVVPLWAVLPPSSFWFIIGGGMLYTSAVIFYCWDSLRYANAIWHACVLVATGCMFWGISTALAAALVAAPQIALN